METERRILNKIMGMRQTTKSTKFVGALTTELFRKEFVKLGLSVSNRDIFIEGIPNELDLLIAKTGKNPEENLVYTSSDVLAVLEIKFRGSYGKSSLERIKKVFDAVKKANKRIEYLFVSVSENKNYKYRATKEGLGCDCFELFTRSTNLESALRKKQLKPTGDWQRLVTRLRRLKE